MEAKGDGPAVGHVGAVLRHTMPSEDTPHVNDTSIAHKAQVMARVSFTAHLPCSSSPLIPHSPLMFAARMRPTLAELTVVTTTIASEVEGVGAVVIGSIDRGDVSVLLTQCVRSLQPPLEQHGGGSGAAAWQLEPGGSGG